MKAVQCHKSMFFIYNSNDIRFKLYSNFQNSFKNRSLKHKLENYRTSLNEAVSRRLSHFHSINFAIQMNFIYRCILNMYCILHSIQYLLVGGVQATVCRCVKGVYVDQRSQVLDSSNSMSMVWGKKGFWLNLWHASQNTSKLTGSFEVWNV